MGHCHAAVLRYDAASRTLTGFLDGRQAAGTAVGARSMSPASCFAVGAADSQNFGNGGYLRGAVD